MLVFRERGKGAMPGTHVEIDIVRVHPVTSRLGRNVQSLLHEWDEILVVLHIRIFLTVELARIRIIVPDPRPYPVIQPRAEVAILWLGCPKVEIANNNLSTVL